MINKLDIKSVSQMITDMAHRDVGYVELRTYIYNTIKDFVTKAYEQGGKDKEEILRDIKKKQEQKMNEKFKDILDELI